MSRVVCSDFCFFEMGARFNECILPLLTHVPPLILPSCQPSQLKNTEKMKRC